MSDKVKKILGELIYNYDSRPKRIFIRLNHKNIRKKSILCRLIDKSPAILTIVAKL